jgi:hypothetical protein
MFKSFGKLIYSNGRCIVQVGNGLSDFYRSLIPKHIKYNRPRYPAHITVVRTGIETAKLSEWGYKHNKTLKFTYDPYVWIGKKYIFLDSFCEELEEVRDRLGLPRHRIPHPLGMNYSCFHITLANRKIL